MNTTDLTFSKFGNEYKATFTSSGAQVMQLARTAGGRLKIYAYIDGMSPFPIYNAATDGQFVLIHILIPAGMKADVHSESEVTTGKLLTEEDTV